MPSRPSRPTMEEPVDPASNSSLSSVMFRQATVYESPAPSERTLGTDCSAVPAGNFALCAFIVVGRAKQSTSQSDLFS